MTQPGSIFFDGAAAHDEYTQSRARSDALYLAAKALAHHVERSVNVGPVSKNPSREALLWRNLRAAIAAYESTLPTPARDKGEI